MKIDSIILYETERVEDLYPFSIMHCGWEVRCGALRIFEKIQKCFPDSRIIFKARKEHLDSFLARFRHSEQTIIKENLLLINSSIIFSAKLLKQFNEVLNSDYNKINEPLFFTTNSKIIAVYFPKEVISSTDNFNQPFFEDVCKQFHKLSNQVEIKDVFEINFLWDAIDYNGFEIENDSNYFLSPKEENNFKYQNVSFIHPEKIFIGKNCNLAPYVVLDASDGSIILDDNVKIMPNSSIFGPCYIGKNSIIRASAKIYGNTTIGEVCKIGGEVENTIVHAYSNKQHDGYLGHSYLSEWVNIGADTNTSDLKNTYGEIKVNLENREINTHRIFLGLLCGDHIKSGINTMFTTGTVAGISGILVNEWFLPNTISSFSWGGGKNASIFKSSKAIEIAKIVMARRNRTLLPEEELLIQKEYEKVSHSIK